MVNKIVQLICTYITWDFMNHAQPRSIWWLNSFEKKRNSTSLMWTLFLNTPNDHLWTCILKLRQTCSVPANMLETFEPGTPAREKFFSTNFRKSFVMNDEISRRMHNRNIIVVTFTLNSVNVWIFAKHFRLYPKLCFVAANVRKLV